MRLSITDSTKKEVKAMEKTDHFYACFGGFGDQYWTQLTTPNFQGACDCLTLCRVDAQTGAVSVCDQLHGLESPSTLVVSRTNGISIAVMRNTTSRVGALAAA